jgi:mono/diheme cytochrome c family protein
VRVRFFPLLVSSLLMSCLAARPGDALAADQDKVSRGKYLVEGVAECWTCHTPRDEHGDPDRTRWLLGAPVVFRPTIDMSNWAERAPRLSGSPPGTDEDFVKLMMTGISRTGRPPRQPMPRFQMTREDAEAVLAYLKSLGGPK